MTGVTMTAAEQAGPGGARHGKVWLRAVAWALLGLVLLAGSAAAGLAVPGRVADERAFLEARPCGGRDATQGTADCLRTIRGTVLSAERVRSGRATVFRVRLRPPAPAPAAQPVDLDAHGELSESVKPGDEVEVTTWRYVQVSLRHDGVSETLPGLPDEDAPMFAGLALAGVWLASLSFVAAFGGVRRARRGAAGRPLAPPVRFGPAKFAGVVAAPLAAGFVAGRVWDTWTTVVMTVVISAVIALPATVAALRWEHDRSRTPPPAARLDAGRGTAT